MLLVPTAPPRTCSTPGCPELVTRDRPCPHHARKPWATSKRGGSTRAWRLRRMFVLREEPLCRLCVAKGKLTSAIEVDHIVPIARGGQDIYENYQPLCAAHHRAKSQREATPGLSVPPS
jgi:5-methylcytosine-specific restriction protein A